MYSAPRSTLAVTLVFVLSFSGTDAFAQTAKFIRHLAGPLPLAKMDLGRTPCAGGSGNESAAQKVGTASIGDLGSPCDTPSLSVPPLNPCNPAILLPTGCAPARDAVQENLAAMGKPGQKIMRAREKVLEILQGENACSAWFREKDINPSAAFQTLAYAIDRRGEEVVLVSRGPESQLVFRDPYVARVGQDTGAFATITLNAGGAFFRALATTSADSSEGGVSTFGKPRSINVGPYPGDTLDARTLALLHEFGHVLNLLPVDFDNEDGKSMQNTAKVLRFCRAEIKSKVGRSTLSAVR